MPHAKLTVTLPEGVWIRDLSTEFPEATFTVLAALPDGDTGVGLLEITATDIEAILQTVERYDGIVDLDLLRAADGEALVQFETTEPALIVAVRNAGVPLELPLVIADGVAALELTASTDRLAELGDQPSALGMPFDVEFVRQIVDADSPLTDAQRELLTATVERGYYDTPRTCTLTDLADEFDIAKSTASARLHRAEGAVIKQFAEGIDAIGG